MEKRFHSPLFWAATVSIICAALLAIRLAGPTDLEGYAQMLNVGYVMDMMWQGHWLAQHDIETGMMSKPPLHTWLIAPFAAVLGVDRLALALPSFFSILALALVLIRVGRQQFGIVTGGFAALAMVIASPMMEKQITLARTDPLFALTTALAAFAAYRAWTQKGSWIPFWLAAALATLTKGPLGLILAAGGLLAYFWERRTDPATPPPRGSHWAGILLFIAIGLGWFLLAYARYGDELIHKLIGVELVGQAVGAHKPPYSLRNLLTPTAYLLVRFLPFSPFLFYALWRVFRRPAAAPEERRFERFLTCWLLFGMLLFTIVRHQRPDHLLPLWPAGALLVGRELARISERYGPRRIAGIVAVIVVLIIGIAHLRIQRHPQGFVRYGVKVEQAAAALSHTDIDPQRLLHFDTPATFQMRLGTYRPWLKTDALAAAIAQSDSPVDIALGPSKAEVLPFLVNNPKAVRVFRWPEDERQPAAIHIYRVSR